jgi:2-polyprenyl-3-methyl-5-hydroxy-6-metoxy-1,4-benzoquinol methylase
MNISSWEEEVIQHFDENAGSYRDAYEGELPPAHFFKRRQEIIMSLLSSLSRGKLLDVGCGPGLMAGPCTNQGFLYFGTDISKRMIGECRQMSSSPHSASFLVSKMQSLPFSDNFFDVLLCMGALEYVPATQEVAARTEMIRVLKPGGLLIISHLNQLSLYWLWDRFVYKKIRSIVGPIKVALKSVVFGGPQRYNVEEVPIREFTVNSSRHILASHGATVIETLYFGFNVFPPPLDRKFPRAALWAAKVSESVLNRRLRGLAMAFIIMARKEEP